MKVNRKWLYSSDKLVHVIKSRYQMMGYCWINNEGNILMELYPLLNICGYYNVICSCHIYVESHTLSCCQILRIIKVEPIEAPATRFPPPSTLQHGGTVQTWPVIISADTPFNTKIQFTFMQASSYIPSDKDCERFN
jgi:hypothetical protein